MKKRTVFQEAKYKPVEDICRISGMPRNFVYRGVQEGWIPHIRAGKTILINEEKFLEKLDEMSSQKDENHE